MFEIFDTGTPSFAEKLFPALGEIPAPSLHDLRLDLQPAGHSPAELREWLRGLADAHNLTSTRLARAAGLAPSTLNRFLADEGSSRNLSATTLDSLAQAISTLIRDGSDNDLSERSKSYSIMGSKQILYSTEVIGLVAANLIQRRLQVSPSDRMRITVPIHFAYEAKPIWCFGINSFAYHPIFGPGTILICTPTATLGRDPNVGEKYIVHTALKEGVECTIREFSSDPTGKFWLIPIGRDVNKSSSLFIGDDSGSQAKTSYHRRATFLIIGHYSADRKALQAYMRDDESGYRVWAEEQARREGEAREEEQGSRQEP